jgi:hypothetical protein
LAVKQKKTVKKSNKPRGKVLVKDILHGAPHKVIETKSELTDKEQKENPLNKKAQPTDEHLRKIDECNMWKERVQEQGILLMKKNDEIEALRKGQMLPADKAAPMDIQKMKEQIIALQEKLQPYKYEFTIGGTLVSVMVRPRVREVIPLTQ